VACLPATKVGKGTWTPEVTTGDCESADTVAVKGTVTRVCRGWDGWSSGCDKCVEWTCVRVGKAWGRDGVICSISWNPPLAISTDLPSFKSGQTGVRGQLSHEAQAWGPDPSVTRCVGTGLGGAGGLDGCSGVETCAKGCSGVETCAKGTAPHP